MAEGLSGRHSKEFADLTALHEDDAMVLRCINGMALHGGNI